MRFTSTSLHVEFTQGYIKLGVLNEARDELEAIDFKDRFHPEVLAARIEVHVAARHWDVVVGVARKMRELYPSDVSGCRPARTISTVAAGKKRDDDHRVKG